MTQNRFEIAVIPDPQLFSTLIWLVSFSVLFFIPVLVWGFKGNEASVGVCLLFVLFSLIYYLGSASEYQKMKLLEFSFEAEKLSISGKTFNRSEISLVHISRNEQLVGFIAYGTSYILNLTYFDKPKEILEYFKQVVPEAQSQG